MAGSSYTMQKGFNPFLAEAEVPAANMMAEQAQISNPFLSDASFAPSNVMYQDVQGFGGHGGDNPFLSYSSQAAVEPPAASANPFADVVYSSYTQQGFTDMNQSTGWPSYGSENITTDTQMRENLPAYSGMFEAAEPVNFNRTSENVPRSTQDLLQTVTGALEATSDTLLDRLRITQPSPLPQPPSPTPSPRTPSPEMMDLLGGFDETSAPMSGMNLQQQTGGIESNSIIDILDIQPSQPVDIMELYKVSSSAPEIAPPAVPHTVEIQQNSYEEDKVEPTPETKESTPFSSANEDVTPPRVDIPIPENEFVQPKLQPEVKEFTPMEAIKQPPERPKAPTTPPEKKPSPLPSRPPPPVPKAPVRPAPPAVPQLPKPVFQETSIVQETKPVEVIDNIPSFVPVISRVDEVKSRKTETETKKSPDFDSFDQQFESLADSAQEPEQAWGDSTDAVGESELGFDNSDGFDNFLALTEPPPVPQSTPSKHFIDTDRGDIEKEESTDLTIFIRPKGFETESMPVPTLAPPPKSPAISTGSAFSEDSQPFVPFLSSGGESKHMSTKEKSDSLDSPQTPLFEEDQSQPLEDFPRVHCETLVWEMHMRHPNKKKITGQRFWKKVFVRLTVHNDVPIIQISNNKTDKDPIQEIPLQPCYSVSDIAAQQFDQYGKIFTIKLQYIFYKERPGVRPGQITKAGNITNKLSQFAAFAIQGDYQGVKEFGSDLKKLGLPVEHAPQISQLVKLGTQSFEEMKQFSMCIEEALFKLPVHRDRAITYKTEEIQVTLVDEYYVEQDIYGVILKQIARVRLFFLSFLSGNTEIELGINDIRRQGKEVVGRHDIITIPTEEWIRTEAIEFSTCVQLDEFERTKMVKFKPPDACYIELLRFRVRPPKHRELPLQVKTVFTTTGHRIEIRCDILVPGFTSRKLGQIPCEDVMVRIPIPETWIYMFRVEKHFRYGSVKSAHRRSGKVKGIERFLGAVEAVENSLMEVTSGQAKYEHQHRSIVWRVSRLPKEGQGAYTTHSFFCHITLQPHEEVPDNLTKFCYVEFTMPHTTISHTVCRSISVPMCDEPPEKCVRYLSRHEYVVEIEHTTGVAPASYSLAAVTEEKKTVAEVPQPEMKGKAESDSDFSD